MTLRNLSIKAFAALLAVSAPVALADVNGGGKASSDCYNVFKGVTATSGIKVDCKDGDACDADGTANGSCTFNVRACAFETLPGCTPQAVTGYSGNWVKKFGYSTPAPGVTTPTCGDPAQVVVPLKGKKKNKPGKRKLTLKAKSAGSPKTDPDKILLRCLFGTGGTGGNSCLANPAGGPSQLTLTTAPTGSDLDTGFSGKSHNFIVPNGSQLHYCLTECDESSNPVCIGEGATDAGGSGSLNGPTFGPPLPLFSSNVAVCVINRFKDPTIKAIINLQDGSLDARATPVNLLADTYQGSATQVCPRCTNGTCDSGRNQGAKCTVDGTVVVNNPPNIVNANYPVSRDCLPSGNALLGTPEVALNLYTGTVSLAGNAAGNLPCPGQPRHTECTGSATCTVDCSAESDFKGGVQQFCCTDAQKTDCFPTDAATGIGKIDRTGTPVIPQPAWPDPTYPKAADGGVLAATFCIPSTTSILVDGTAGLPGPGALLLPGSVQFKK